jgi:hypothetical protein
VNPTPAYPRRYGSLLYCRSRMMPGTLLALAATALLAVGASFMEQSWIDEMRRVPAVALAPVLASAAIGASLYQYSAELDLGAVRAWYRRRLAHLAGLTALTAGALALAVPGEVGGFGPPQMTRNLMGAVGLTAAAATVLGARMSWVPTTAYLCSVFVGGEDVTGRKAIVLAWPLQPGGQPLAWAVALALFVLGGAAFVLRGPRAGRDRS